MKKLKKMLNKRHCALFLFSNGKKKDETVIGFCVLQ